MGGLRKFRQINRGESVKSIIINNIIESIPIGLLVIESGGEIALSNHAAADILGFDRDELVGKGWAELFFHEKRNDDFNQVFLDAIWQRQVNLQRQVDYWRPTEDRRRLSVNSSFLMDDGELAGVVVLISDITELDRTREGEKAALKEKALFQKERVEALKRLALGVAHEIRNPIVVIGGFARRMLLPLEDKNEPCENKQYLDAIISGTKRLEAIVQSVKEYADITADHLTRMNPALIFAAAVDLAKERCPENSRKVVFKTKSRADRISANPVLLTSALVEVLVNAVESIKGENGLVTINGFLEDDAYRIEVTDNGEGISEKDMPFVYDLFFSTKADALGMGLPKAQRAMAESKGRMKIDSQPSKGTTVTLTIPREAASAGEGRTIHE